MKVRDFINAYRPNDISIYNVWSFTVNCFNRNKKKTLDFLIKILYNYNIQS